MTHGSLSEEVGVVESWVDALAVTDGQCFEKQSLVEALRMMWKHKDTPQKHEIHQGSGHTTYGHGSLEFVRWWSARDAWRTTLIAADRHR